MRLILHIGTAKTGTTSLQTALHTNREILREFGVLYPTAPAGSINHNFLTTALGPSQKIEREFLRVAGGDEPSIRALGAKYWTDLQLEVKQSSADVVVLSGEYFYGMAAESVSQLGQLLDELSSDIDVVCYVRDPAAYYVSMMQQQVKASYVVPPPSRFRWRAQECLSHYLDVFGGSVSVRSAELPALIGGDVRHDFIESFIPQVTALDKLTDAPNLNESMSAEAMCIMQSVRRHGWPDENGRFAAESDRMIAMLSEIRTKSSVQRSPALRPDVETAFLARHGDDLGFIIEQFGVAVAGYDEPSHPAASEEPPGWRSSELIEILDVDRDDVERVTVELLRALAQRPTAVELLRDLSSRLARRVRNRRYGLPRETVWSVPARRGTRTADPSPHLR